MSDWADEDLYDRISGLQDDLACRTTERDHAYTVIEMRDTTVAELRATIGARDEALMRAGRDNLRDYILREYGAMASAVVGVDDLLATLDAVPASPRRAETTAELDALPVGAIVLDSDEIGPPPFVHVGPDVWWIVDHEMYSDRCDFQTIDIVRPATVLYMPPADGEGER